MGLFFDWRISELLQGRDLGFLGGMQHLYTYRVVLRYD